MSQEVTMYKSVDGSVYETAAEANSNDETVYAFAINNASTSDILELLNDANDPTVNPLLGEALQFGAGRLYGNRQAGP